MIIGHGIDVQEIAAVAQAYEKHTRFARRVLTENEFKRFDALTGKRQIEYLAGRWAAKEAYSKALGTGIGAVGFQDIEVLSNQKGAPFISALPDGQKAWVSISHSKDYVVASVILEVVE